MGKPAKESFLPGRRDLENLACHYESAEMAESLPALYQLLCHAKRDGHYRAGARLSFFADGGRLKASVYDPDTNQVWFGTLEGWERMVEAVEGLLQQRRGEWRESRPNGRK